MILINSNVVSFPWKSSNEIKNKLTELRRLSTLRPAELRGVVMLCINRITLTVHKEKFDSLHSNALSCAKSTMSDRQLMKRLFWSRNWNLKKSFAKKFLRNQKVFKWFQGEIYFIVSGSNRRPYTDSPRFWKFYHRSNISARC